MQQVLDSRYLPGELDTARKLGRSRIRRDTPGRRAHLFYHLTSLRTLHPRYLLFASQWVIIQEDLEVRELASMSRFRVRGFA